MKLNYKTKQVFDDNNVEITPEKSLKLQNHSPDGFNWGYTGSGPAQLSLAVLLHFTKDDKFSLAHYQDLKRELIGHFPMKDWDFPDLLILKWIDIWKNIDELTKQVKLKQPKLKSKEI